MRGLIIVINLDVVARVVCAIVVLLAVYAWAGERDIADREQSSKQVRK